MNELPVRVLEEEWPRWIERLLAGAWFAFFYAALSSIMAAVTLILVSRMAVPPPEIPPFLLRSLAWGTVTYGVAGALRGWRVSRRGLEEADGFRIGAGVGAVAAGLAFAGLLWLSRESIFGSADPWNALRLGITACWHLGSAASIGAVGGWCLLGLRTAIRRSREPA